jgi:hypothetical protein
MMQRIPEAANTIVKKLAYPPVETIPLKALPLSKTLDIAQPAAVMSPMIEIQQLRLSVLSLSTSRIRTRDATNAIRINGPAEIRS